MSHLRQLGPEGPIELPHSYAGEDGFPRSSPSTNAVISSAADSEFPFVASDETYQSAQLPLPRRPSAPTLDGIDETTEKQNAQDGGRRQSEGGGIHFIHSTLESVKAQLSMEEGMLRKRRARTSSQQLLSLQNAFAENPKPDSAFRTALADSLGMTHRAVQVWFQNKRAKTKSEQRRGSTVEPSASLDIAALGTEHPADDSMLSLDALPSDMLDMATMASDSELRRNSFTASPGSPFASPAAHLSRHASIDYGEPPLDSCFPPSPPVSNVSLSPSFARRPSLLRTPDASPALQANYSGIRAASRIHHPYFPSRVVSRRHSVFEHSSTLAAASYLHPVELLGAPYVPPTAGYPLPQVYSGGPFVDNQTTSPLVMQAAPPESQQAGSSYASSYGSASPIVMTSSFAVSGEPFNTFTDDEDQQYLSMAPLDPLNELPYTLSSKYTPHQQLGHSSSVNNPGSPYAHPFDSALYTATSSLQQLRLSSPILHPQNPFPDPNQGTFGEFIAPLPPLPLPDAYGHEAFPPAELPPSAHHFPSDTASSSSFPPHFPPYLGAEGQPTSFVPIDSQPFTNLPHPSTNFTLATGPMVRGHRRADSWRRSMSSPDLYNLPRGR
ncbi:hypothetical protein HKX48_004011 [Thoreauomyces humboldtii]|nr:hypothetical protein HKX48_004011 [Thoreauomyces humboldtii]